MQSLQILLFHLDWQHALRIGDTIYLMSKRRGFSTTVLVGILLAIAPSASGGAPTIPEWRPPDLHLPVPNGYDDFLKSGQMVDDVKADRTQWAIALYPVSGAGMNQSLKPTPDEQVAAAKMVLARGAPSLALFREGLEKPSRVAIDFVDFKVRGDELFQFRNLARLLEIEGWLREQNGNYRGAAATYLDLADFGNHIMRGGLLIHRLTGLTLLEIGLGRLQTVLPHLDAKALALADSRLDAADRRMPPMSETFQMEKAYTHGHVLYYLRGSPATNEWLEGTEAESTANAATRANVEAVIRESRPDPAVYLKALDDQWDFWADNADRPYVEAARNSPPPTDYETLKLDTRNALGADFWAAKMLTHLRLLELQVALNRYHENRHAYPDTLGALAPKFLTTIPNDPFTGAPFVYRGSGATFLLYSPGPDGKDDGGATAYPLHDDSKGDVTLDSFVPPSKRSAP